LALVSAVLSMLIQSGLRPEHAESSSAASRLALGQLTAVAAQLDMTPQQLANIYVSAFQSLMLMLSGVTVLTALMVFAFLRSPGQQLLNQNIAQHNRSPGGRSRGSRHQVTPLKEDPRRDRMTFDGEDG